MKVKKSQIIYDLDKISIRLEEMKAYSKVAPFNDELCEAQRIIDKISSNLNGGDITFSLTGRRSALANPIEKCRFCGEPK